MSDPVIALMEAEYPVEAVERAQKRAIDANSRLDNLGSPVRIELQPTSWTEVEGDEVTEQGWRFWVTFVAARPSPFIEITSSISSFDQAPGYLSWQVMNSGLIDPMDGQEVPSIDILFPAIGSEPGLSYAEIGVGLAYAIAAGSICLLKPKDSLFVGVLDDLSEQTYSAYADYVGMSIVDGETTRPYYDDVDSSVGPVTANFFALSPPLDVVPLAMGTTDGNTLQSADVIRRFKIQDDLTAFSPEPLLEAGQAHQLRVERETL